MKKFLINLICLCVLVQVTILPIFAIERIDKNDPGETEKNVSNTSLNSTDVIIYNYDENTSTRASGLYKVVIFVLS